LASCEESDGHLLLHEFEKKVREVIFLLSPQRQKVFNLSRDEGLTHDQIARMLNISKSTVNIHLVESRKFIRLHLSKSIDISLLIYFLGKI
ncbi:MAG: sigma factor-like helix-turn-helix DNA-binding protein, partial [Ginsengibacter sp.]